MKRLKTICLTLFVYLSLSLTTGFAQSSSCAGETNLGVDASCRYVVTLEGLRATGPAATAGSIKFKIGNNGTVQTFSGGSVSGTVQDLGIPNGGSVQYELYASTDGTGQMVCWGRINFELKGVPDPIINVYEIMCSQPFPDLPTIDELKEDLKGLCIAPISELFETRETDGEACSGFITVRTITGLVDYGHVKLNAPLVIDTIIETPLDTSMVNGPLGGPTKLDAIILFCDDIGNQYPTPELVEEFSAEGLKGAYPYIPKGLDTLIEFIDTTIQLLDTVEEMIMVVDDFGNEFWVRSDVIHKRDTMVQIPDTTITDVILPLKEGPTCNLSTKFTDMQFPGCAGPDGKIMRMWSVLDWCNGSLKESVQWIVVETEGPIITPVEDAFAAIAPWVCSADYQLEAEIDRGCSESLVVIFESTVGIVEEGKCIDRIMARRCGPCHRHGDR